MVQQMVQPALWLRVLVLTPAQQKGPPMCFFFGGGSLGLAPTIRQLAVLSLNRVKKSGSKSELGVC